MRRMLLAAAIALLGFAGSAFAQGTIVRWNDVVGLQGHEEGTPNRMVGDMIPFPYWIWVAGGKVMLNLDTGEVHIQIRNVSWAQNIPGGPLGAVLGGYPFDRRGTFVCDARGANGGPEQTQTEVMYLDKTGSVNYQGTVDVLQICRDYPDQIAFVFGGGRTRYFAYGVAREVIGPE